MLGYPVTHPADVTMKSRTTTFLVVLTAGVAAPALAQSPVDDFSVVDAATLQWTPIPDALGAAAALVHGNPAQPGTYVIRVRFPAGVMDRPHVHSSDRHVTVIEGTWYAGTGEHFDPASAVLLQPGDYMFHPAGGVHWDGAGGDESAVVQIIGQGPVTTSPLDEALPFWLRVDLPRH